MSERRNPILTFIIAFLGLLAILAIISPDQFQILIDTFSQSGDLFLVIIFIAFVSWMLKRARRL